MASEIQNVASEPSLTEVYRNNPEKKKRLKMLVILEIRILCQHLEHFLSRKGVIWAGQNFVKVLALF